MELKKEDIQMLRVKSRATSQVTFDADYNVPRKEECTVFLRSFLWKRH